MSHGLGSGVHRLLFLLGNNELPSLLRQRRKNSSSETGPSHISSVLDHLLLYIIVHYAEARLHTFFSTSAVIPSAYAAFGQRECSALCYFSLFCTGKVMHVVASLIKWTSLPYFLCRTEARLESRLYIVTAVYLKSSSGQQLHLHSFPLRDGVHCVILDSRLWSRMALPKGTGSLENCCHPLRHYLQCIRYITLLRAVYGLRGFFLKRRKSRHSVFECVTYEMSGL